MPCTAGCILVMMVLAKPLLVSAAWWVKQMYALQGVSQNGIPVNHP